MKIEQSLRDLWNAIKHANTYIVGIPSGKEKEKGAKRMFRERIVEMITMAEQKDTELTTTPMNTSKIHPRVEQFSLKTNGKLAERLQFNQGRSTHIK